MLGHSNIFYIRHASLIKSMKRTTSAATQSLSLSLSLSLSNTSVKVN